MRSVLAPSLLTLAAMAAASPSFAATTYTIQVISPSTGVYLNPQGGTYVTSVTTNAAGDVAGLAAVQPVLGSGLQTNSGQVAWYYNPITGKTTPIDLASLGMTPSVAGMSYLQSTGYGSASVVALTSTGYVAGTNSIYNNGNLNGGDSWVYAPATSLNGTGTTYRVPALNIQGANLPGSTTSSMNIKTVTNAGVAVGSLPLWASTGFSQAGNAAWVYTVGSSTTTTAITINNASNTSSDGVVSYTDTSGYVHIFVNATSAISGMVAGTAQGYDNNFFGSSLGGSDAWILNTANGNSFATIISPGAGVSSFGATFTSDNTNEGLRSATVGGMNAAGQVIGTSTRYVGGSAAGYDAWVYNGTNTQIIGLHDSSYVTSAGITNTAFAISGNGIVAGYVVPGNTSFQSSNILRDVWVYKPGKDATTAGTTIRVGLFGAAYTSSSTQLRSSAIGAVGSGGQVAGTTLRYDSSGVNFQNQDAWYVNANTATSTADTKMIGLNSQTIASGAIYENNGQRFSAVTSVNALGEAAGYSTRYSGGSSVGQDAFVYDPGTDKDYVVNNSVSTTGAAFSVINYLSDTGVALGVYTVYSGSTVLGNDLFAWQLVNGVPQFTDLGSEITNLSAGQWASLASIISSDTNGDIIGLGQLAGYTGTSLGSNTSTSVFLLTPTSAVPEPASLGMLALGGVAMLRRSRRGR